MERKLTTILCADVHGYSRLMGEDEEATLGTLSGCRKLIDTLIESHRGRFVNSAGDSVLAEFTSVVEAVNCAVAIQSAIEQENAQLPVDRRMEFRIGVNLGDVMAKGEQIYGDGVNVAARLEGLAEAGGICISGTVYKRCAISWLFALKTAASRRSRISHGRCMYGGLYPTESRHLRDFNENIGVAEYCADRPLNRRWNIRAGAASIVEAAAHVRLDPACTEAGLAIAHHSVNCGAAVC